MSQIVFLSEVFSSFSSCSRSTMNKSLTKFEDLPNEIIGEIFKCLDARDVFRCFSHLNSRLCRLTRWFDHLQLKFHLRTANGIKFNEETFPFYVHSLSVDPWINSSLNRFRNVRRLKLESPLPHILQQIKPELMNFLENLSVSYTFNMYEIVVLHDQIFSNSFQRLTSCELLEKETPLTIRRTFSTVSKITNLRVNFIDFDIFSTILSVCPNLKNLKFSLLTRSIPKKIFSKHFQLEQIFVELRSSDWLFDDENLRDFLLLLPNLKLLQLTRRRSALSIDNYDWFHSIRTELLPNLETFRFLIDFIEKNNDPNFVVFNEFLRRKSVETFDELHGDLKSACLIFK